MMAAAQGLGPIDDAGFFKVYDRFNRARIAGSKAGEEENQ
jgi:hypothetical protein